MSGIDQLFDHWRREHRKPLIPFLVAGDPDLETTVATLAALAQAGIPLAEIGFPYSDPIADGPTIQAAYTRALARGVRVRQILDALATYRSSSASHVVGMVSYSIVYRHGVDRWVGETADAGFAGLIVPDLPCEEAAGLELRCRQRDISLVQLIAPTTPRDRALRILEHAHGFVYYVSVAGVTGERTDLPTHLPEQLAALRAWTHLPICIGFGVRDADQVRALAPHVDGVIVGSALINRMEAARRQGAMGSRAIHELVDFCTTLQDALNGTTDCRRVDPGET